MNGVASSRVYIYILGHLRFTKDWYTLRCPCVTYGKFFFLWNLCNRQGCKVLLHMIMYIIGNILSLYYAGDVFCITMDNIFLGTSVIYRVHILLDVVHRVEYAYSR